MVANNKVQVVLSHHNSIVVNEGQQPLVMLAPQPSVKFIQGLH